MKTLDANVQGLASGRLLKDQIASLNVKSVFDQGGAGENGRGEVLLF